MKKKIKKSFHSPPPLDCQEDTIPEYPSDNQPVLFIPKSSPLPKGDLEKEVETYLQNLGDIKEKIRLLEQANELQEEIDNRARLIETHLRFLKEASQKQNIQSAEYLVQLAVVSTHEVEKLCQEKPKLMLRIAADRIFWPGLNSDRAGLNKAHTNYIPSLRLGSSTNIKMGGKWNLSNPYIQTAITLYVRLFKIQKSIQGIKYCEGLLSARPTLMITPDYKEKALSLLKEDKKFFPEIEKLPPLTKKTFPEYRSVLREMYLFEEPNPEKLAKFRNVKNYSERESPGAQRAKICDLILQRFSHILR